MKDLAKETESFHSFCSLVGTSGDCFWLFIASLRRVVVILDGLLEAVGTGGYFGANTCSGLGPQGGCVYAGVDMVASEQLYFPVCDPGALTRR